jgi:hypothetical protein
MDPLDNMQRKAWWLLYPGDKAQLRFSGTRLGILTMVGPDAGIITCEVDGGAWRTRINLCDAWSYFWRLAVVSLVDELPKGQHVATVTLETEVPDRTVLKRPPSGPFWTQCKADGKHHKLCTPPPQRSRAPRAALSLGKPRADELRRVRGTNRDDALARRGEQRDGARHGARPRRRRCDERRRPGAARRIWPRHRRP